MKHWITQVVIALDQVLNAILGGYADETLSSCSYRMWRDGKRSGRLMPVIDKFFFWEKYPPEVVGHCHSAYLSELARQGLPPSMRNER